MRGIPSLRLEKSQVKNQVSIPGAWGGVTRVGGHPSTQTAGEPSHKVHWPDVRSVSGWPTGHVSLGIPIQEGSRPHCLAWEVGTGPKPKPVQRLSIPVRVKGGALEEVSGAARSNLIPGVWFDRTA